MDSNIVSGIAQLVIHDIEVGAAEDEVGMFSSARDNEGAGIASESTWSPAVPNPPPRPAAAVSPRVKREDVHKYLPEPDMAGYFYLFPFLPIELRAKIWELILPQPRVLSLVFNVSRGSVKVYSEYHRGIVHQGAWMIETEPILNMLLLAVCQESGAETQKFIQKHKYEKIHLLRDITKRTWFLCEVGTLYLTTGQKAWDDEDLNSLPPSCAPLDNRTARKCRGSRSTLSFTCLGRFYKMSIKKETGIRTGLIHLSQPASHPTFSIKISTIILDGN